LAEQESISFFPGDVCYSAKTPSRHIRLCYSQMKESEMEEGLQRFLRLLGRFLQ